MTVLSSVDASEKRRVRNAVRHGLAVTDPTLASLAAAYAEEVGDQRWLRRGASSVLCVSLIVGAMSSRWLWLESLNGLAASTVFLQFIVLDSVHIVRAKQSLPRNRALLCELPDA